MPVHNHNMVGLATLQYVKRPHVGVGDTYGVEAHTDRVASYAKAARSKGPGHGSKRTCQRYAPAVYTTIDLT